MEKKKTYTLTLQRKQLLKTLKARYFNGYYSPLPALKSGTPYVAVIGERDNGKTFAYLIAIFDAYINHGKRSVWVRRLAESLKASKIRELFDKVFKLNIIKNNYDGVAYRSGAFRFFTMDEKGKKEYTEPFCYTFALNTAETDKGTKDIQDLAYIVFDEFLTRDGYLQNEFVRFTNALSTLIRDNEDVCIVMLANTVSWTAPYFRELGIKNPQNLKQDTLTIYEYGESDCALCLEYCGVKQTNKNKSVINDRYFAFNNSQISMIRDGSWEMASYPHPTHCPDDDVIITRDIYIKYEDDCVCIEVHENDDSGVWVLVRPYRIDIDDRAMRIYSDEVVNDSRYHANINSNDKIDRLIWGLYKQRQFFYSDNTCGETVRNFVQNTLQATPLN